MAAAASEQRDACRTGLHKKTVCNFVESDNLERIAD